MKLPVFATALMLCGVTILCALGTWQLQRLEWKTALLADLAAEYQKDPAQFPISGKVLQHDDLQHRRGVVSGQLEPRKTFLVGPRTYDGTPGYHAYTPLITNNTAILVNRGWVPLDWTEPSPRTEQRKISGMFRRPDTQGIFTPDNAPDNDTWYWLDFTAIQQAKDLPQLSPYILYMEASDTADETPPVAQQLGVNLNNNHLQYALFWFFLAVAMIVIYVLRFLKPHND